jgi:hypothetical protein
VVVLRLVLVQVVALVVIFVLVRELVLVTVLALVLRLVLVLFLVRLRSLVRVLVVALGLALGLVSALVQVLALEPVLLLVLGVVEYHLICRLQPIHEHQHLHVMIISRRCMAMGVAQSRGDNGTSASTTGIAFLCYNHCYEYVVEVLILDSQRWCILVHGYISIGVGSDEVQLQRERALGGPCHGPEPRKVKLMLCLSIFEK